MNLIFSDERMPGQTIIDHMKNAAELCVREENLDPELIEISVTFVSTEEIHELNRVYRNNDSVTDVLSFPQYSSVEEIKIGDNDTLGALTANLWNADLLIVMSDIDGVYNKDPKGNKDAELIEEVYDTDSLLAEIDSRGKSNFGTGGIVTKIHAARMVNEYGIPMLLINGKRRDVLTEIVEGVQKGTIFFSQRRQGK
jgi:hypothetical protein